jgi:hypothetical protein
MDDIFIDSTDLQTRIANLDTLIADGTCATTLKDVGIAGSGESKGATAEVVRSYHGEEFTRIDTALASLLTLSRDVLQGVNDRFTGTDSDLATQIAQGGV